MTYPLIYIIICFKDDGIAHCEMLDAPPKPSFFEGYDEFYDSYAVLEGYPNGGDTAAAVLDFNPRDHDA